MKIIQGTHSGFCSGVTYAINCVYDNLHRTPLYTYGAIIHNEQILDELKKQGVGIIDGEQALECVKEGTVIIRSHGIPPQTYDILHRKQINYIDTTCVFIKKVQKIVAEHYAKGYKIVILGQSKHPEIIGINGHADNNAYIVMDLDEINTINLSVDDPICLVTQTTFNKWKYEQIKEWLEARYNNLKIFSTMCHATLQRQEDTEKLSKIADVVLVIGGENSSNTKKIYDIAKKNCPRTFSIKSFEDINRIQLNRNDTVYVQAGASTPNKMTNKVIEKLKELEQS